VGETPPSLRGLDGTTTLAEGMARTVSTDSGGLEPRTGEEAPFDTATGDFTPTAAWWDSYDDAVRDRSMFIRYSDLRNFRRSSSRFTRDASMAEMTSGKDRITGLMTEYICCSTDSKAKSADPGNAQTPRRAAYQANRRLAVVLLGQSHRLTVQLLRQKGAKCSELLEVQEPFL
jgi:hypothetical protein